MTMIVTMIVVAATTATTATKAIILLRHLIVDEFANGIQSFEMNYWIACYIRITTAQTPNGVLNDKCSEYGMYMYFELVTERGHTTYYI